MKIQILDKTKKKKLIQELNHLGIKKIPQLLLKSGKERIRAFSGSFSKQEIMTFWKLLPLEGLGMYFAKQNIDKSGKKETRLSIDALHLLKTQITKNIIELNKSQKENWFKGKTIELNKPTKLKGFVAVKSKQTKDFIGTGKISQDKTILFNYLPKERRIKN